ncbi:MAG: ABC transporter ATP-binding protein [Trueperaceae bacterium]|nr:ABC transporter ATP-binding protein [Trueperaceae bacterium]
MSVLEVSELELSYGGIRALKGVSLSLEEGQITVLLGANGAGKTSLLKAISGLVKPSKGEIKLWGESSLGWPAYRITSLGVAHVPEGRGIFAGLSVRENLQIGGFLAPSKEMPARIEQALTLFPRLKERYSQLAGSLSGGEQQMLALARALVARPRLLLLDEPSLGLAPIIAQEIFRTIRQVHQTGLSVLVVEQNARLALQVADYAYVLKTGEVETHGPASEIRGLEQVSKAYLGVT